MTKSRPDTIGGALCVALSIILWFWLIPVWVEPDPDLRLPVSLLPGIVAVGFLLCGVGLLIKSAIAAGPQKHRQTQTTTQTSVGFEAGELRGLLSMLVLLLAATVAFQFFHFLIVAPLLVAIMMWMFGPVRPVSLILTSSIGPILIWWLATHVLGRVLP